MNDQARSPAQQLARNVRRVARLEIPGGGQVVVQGRHAFVGHMKPPHGTTIVDVEDPANPRVVATIPLPDARSHTHKVRVAGDVMITNVEMNNRHLLRRGSQRLVEAEARLAGTLGRPATDQELAAELKVKAGDIALVREFMRTGYHEGGCNPDDLVAYVNALDSPPLLVGHSMGGLLVQLVAARTHHAGLVAACPGSAAGIFGTTPTNIRMAPPSLLRARHGPSRCIRRRWSNSTVDRQL